MQHLKSQFLIALLFSFSLAVFSGCDPDKSDDPDLPPVDSDPVVTLVSPATGYALARIGETVDITFEIHDNELLNSWDATETWISATGVTVVGERQIAGEYTVLSTTNTTRTISYTVPQGIQVYSTIEVRAYAEDNKGKRASSLFKINVIPETDTTTAYELQKYENDTIWSVTTGDRYAMSIYAPFQPGNNGNLNPSTQQYIREISQNPALEFIFESPIWGGQDSVIVTTNESMFNYDDADYETIWQAFVTSNRIGKTSDALGVSDVMILKLPTTPSQHYAVFRVKERNPNNCGCIVYDFMYSYE